MLVALFSDIHGSTRRVLQVLDRLVGVDALLIAGDLTEFGNAEDAERILAPLRVRVPHIWAVGGNCDRASVRDYLSTSGLSLDSRLVEWNQLSLAGVGGGLFRTGITPDERKDGELGDALRSALSSPRTPALVILSHTPPHGTEADWRHASHVGSMALRSILDEFHPALWVSGHIHESRSLARLNGTLIVNPGPLHEGFYALADIVPSPQGEPRIEARLMQCDH